MLLEDLVRIQTNIHVHVLHLISRRYFELFIIKEIKNVFLIDLLHTTNLIIILYLKLFL